MDIILYNTDEFFKNTDPNSLKQIKVTIYEQAYSRISVSERLNPQNRQSATHSLVYVIATLLRRAFEKAEKFKEAQLDEEEIWKHLMMLPVDYCEHAIFNEQTRALMQKITLV